MKLYTVNPAAALCCGLWSSHFYTIVARYRVGRSQEQLCRVRDVSTGELNELVPVKFLQEVGR